MNRLIMSVACVLSFGASGPSGPAFARAPGADSSLDAHQQLARDIFRQLIEIKTTQNEGSTKAVRAMAARLRSAGFSASDIQVVGPSPQHMNLVARYRGRGVRRPLLWIAHLDVVEALRQDWLFDPFIFLEKDGYFYGRGTLDIKCEAAELIANLIRFRKESYLPERDLIIALTEDEEGGEANGIQWLLANRRDLIDAEYCINTDAGGGEIKNGRHIVMELQTGEKAYFDIRFETNSRGGHSALPVKDNAIYRLAGALVRLSQFEFPLRLNETTRLFYERSSARESGQTRAEMMAMAKTPLDSVAANRLARSSAYYNSLLRTTCVATMLGGGHAENALPQRAYANVNCRMLPDERPEDVLATLKAVVADSQVAIRISHLSARGPFSALRKDVLERVEKVTASLWPGVVVTPIMSTGASDGKYLRLAGIPVYGVSGMFSDIDDIRAHGKDERIGVREFYEGVQFMYRLIKALTSEP